MTPPDVMVVVIDEAASQLADRFARAFAAHQSRGEPFTTSAERAWIEAGCNEAPEPVMLGAMAIMAINAFGADDTDTDDDVIGEA